MFPQAIVPRQLYAYALRDRKYLNNGGLAKGSMTLHFPGPTKDTKMATSSTAVSRVMLTRVIALEITTMPEKMIKMTLTIDTETP